jgi:hypothetical protein
MGIGGRKGKGFNTYDSAERVNLFTVLPCQCVVIVIGKGTVVWVGNANESGRAFLLSCTFILYNAHQVVLLLISIIFRN